MKKMIIFNNNPYIVEKEYSHYYLCNNGKYKECISKHNVDEDSIDYILGKIEGEVTT